MQRCVAAFILTITFSCLLISPLVAMSRPGCAGCVRADRCCCVARQGSDGCALVRPCASGSEADGVSAPRGVEKGLPVAIISTMLPLAPAQVVLAARPLHAADSSRVPPDPPPRTSL